MKFNFLLIAGGQEPTASFLKRALNISGALITVDRGLDVALKNRSMPDVHVGDHDSADKKNLNKVPGDRILTLKKDKDLSDLEFALSILHPESFKLVIGAHRDNEGRFDHAAVNLFVTLNCPNVILADEQMWATGFSEGTLTFETRAHTVFSIIPLTSNPISINGAHYQGKNIVFQNASQGLSNKTGSFRNSRGTRVRTSIKTASPILLFVHEDIAKVKTSAPYILRRTNRQD